MGRSFCAERDRQPAPPARFDRTPPPSLDALLHVTARGHGQWRALVHADGELTFAELSTAANRLAGALGIRVGERVAVVAPNVPALIVGMFGVWRAGGVAVPLSARLRSYELRRILADAQPAVAVSVGAHTGFALADEIAGLADRVSALRTGIVVDPLGGILSVWNAAGPQPAPAPEPAGVAAILYTSGTTGDPKGALVSHSLGVAMAQMLADVLGDEADAAYGLVVPASHAFGLACMLCGILAGATAVLVDATSSIKPLLTALARHDARVLHGSPSLFGALLRSGAENLTLRTGLTAGSLCPPGVLASLDDRGTRVLNLYGMTELGCVSCCRAHDAPAVRYGTVGQALPGYELRVGSGGANGDPREVQVRSRYLPDGCRGRAWTEDEVTDDGWFRTGDLGTLDADGNLTISGRAKEVVDVGGFNVFPAEVESYLLAHPEIAQAAVIGVPHPVLGETLRAFVVPIPGSALQPRDVTRYARAGIAGYKIPYAVDLIEELPLLASGKPDRRALAAGSDLGEG